MSDLILFFKKFFSIYCLIITILGTIGNTFSCFVCLRKRLRKTTLFKLFAFINISDALGLYEWNLQNFFVNFATDYDFVYLWYCKSENYLQNVTSELSAWLLVKLYKKFLNKLPDM